MGCASSKAMERRAAMEKQADLKGQHYGWAPHSALDPVSRSISMPAFSNAHPNLQDVHLVPLSLSQHSYGVSMSADADEAAGAGEGAGSLSREDSMISMLRKLHSLDVGSVEGQPKTWAEVSSILEDLRPSIEKHINSKTINTVGEMDVRASKSMSDMWGGDSTMAGNDGRTVFSAQNGFAAGDSLSSRKSKFSFFSRLRRRRSASKTTPGSLNGHAQSHPAADLTPQGSLFDSDLESYKNALKGLSQEEWNAIQSSGAKTGIPNEAPSSESKVPSTGGAVMTKNRETMMKKKKDPLERYEKKCPQGGEKTVVLYTTSLRGIRKTFEDCSSVRTLLQSFCVSIDERDISMHQDFRNELKELMGGPVTVPRMFVKGRYIGGAEEVLQLHEEGQLAPLLESLPRIQGGGQMCDGCGGVRFVPCFECSGSRKVVVEEEVVKCPHCNENGLIQCPICC